MVKSVNIDGRGYIIRECYNCMFYDSDYICCKYPKNPSKLDVYTDRSSGFPDDCPLELVKDCYTCKHEGNLPDDGFMCDGCSITYHADTDIEDPPTRWEAKE